jgi:hypothetical protein
MDLVQASKSVIANLTATATQTASATIDVVGYDALSVDVFYRPTAAGAPAVLRLVDSNDNTTFGTITKLVSGTDYTLVSAGAVGTAVTGSIYRFDLGLQDIKRYVQVQVTPNSAVDSTAATVIVAARLHKGEKGPVSATDKGVTQAVARG